MRSNLENSAELIFAFSCRLLARVYTPPVGLAAAITVVRAGILAVSAPLAEQTCISWPLSHVPWWPAPAALHCPQVSDAVPFVYSKCEAEEDKACVHYLCELLPDAVQAPVEAVVALGP